MKGPSVVDATRRSIINIFVANICNDECLEYRIESSESVESSHCFSAQNITGAIQPMTLAALKFGYGHDGWLMDLSIYYMDKNRADHDTAANNPLMNLILLQPSELTSSSTCKDDSTSTSEATTCSRIAILPADDSRAKHIVKHLQKQSGDRVLVGVEGGTKHHGIVTLLSPHGSVQLTLQDGDCNDSQRAASSDSSSGDAFSHASQVSVAGCRQYGRGSHPCSSGLLVQP